MARNSGGRRWSARVTEESDALDLEPEVFRKRSAKAIADSLKRSAERSHRRKSSPFRSAMSMLTFYINRAGRNLPAERKRVLEKAKDELRKDLGGGDARLQDASSDFAPLRDLETSAPRPLPRTSETWPGGNDRSRPRTVGPKDRLPAKG